MSASSILAVRRRGASSGGRAIVFLGGCPTPWDVLSPLAEVAAATHATFEIALPGYGESVPLEPYSLVAASGRIEDTLAANGVRECAFVGFSAGAYRAFALAVGARLRVVGVYAMAGFASLGPEEAAGLRGLAAALRADVDLRAAAAPRFLSRAFAEAHPEAVAAVGEWLSATSRDVLAAELEAFATAPDLTHGLGALRFPVVARVGSEDAASPVAKSAAIAKPCDGARLETVAGAGHALVYEDLEGTARSLRAWLAALAWTG